MKEQTQSDPLEIAKSIRDQASLLALLLEPTPVSAQPATSLEGESPISPMEPPDIADAYWRAVQAALKRHGFDPGPIDGVRGSKTDGALIKFKAAHGFKNTNYLGPLTQNKLWASADRAVGPSTQALSWPHWLKIAYQYLGLKEIPGAKHNPQILQWWQDIGAGWFKDDETSWCGAFVGGVLLEAKMPILAASEAPRARAWEKWGQRLDGPAVGSVATFWRGSPSAKTGHVAFVLGRYGDRLVCIGGNQSNAVTIANFSLSRATGFGWPQDIELPHLIGFASLPEIADPGHISVSEG